MRDRHDIDGNSLYQLQFDAMIAPGANARQFGIARLEIVPPDLNESEKRLLYHTWLATLTNRMNPTLDGRSNDASVPMSYRTLGDLTGLFEVAQLPLTRLQCPANEAIETFVAGGDCTDVAVKGKSTRAPTLLVAVYPGDRTH